jgi:hypothetical protein
VTKRARVVAAAAGIAILAFGGGAVAAEQLDSQGQLARYLFGPRLVRAEVILDDRGTIRDVRVDRGRIVRVRPGAIVLRERDGRRLAIPLAPAVRVQIDSVDASVSALRRGMVATTVRDGDGPAGQVLAVTR